MRFEDRLRVDVKAFRAGTPELPGYLPKLFCDQAEAVADLVECIRDVVGGAPLDSLPVARILARLDGDSVAARDQGKP